MITFKEAKTKEEIQKYQNWQEKYLKNTSSYDRI